LTEALSDKVAYESTQGTQSDCITLAGIEKGNKNRYNNIWPYEHSRVKLEGLRDGACDYINASHIKSSLTKKRYIATQGPIPATFNVSLYNSFKILSDPFRISGMLCGSKMFE
jgi:protein tyrosine phosphatase